MITLDLSKARDPVHFRIRNEVRSGREGWFVFDVRREHLSIGPFELRDAWELCSYANIVRTE